MIRILQWDVLSFSWDFPRKSDKGQSTSIKKNECDRTEILLTDLYKTYLSVYKK